MANTIKYIKRYFILAAICLLALLCEKPVDNRQNAISDCNLLPGNWISTWSKSDTTISYYYDTLYHYYDSAMGNFKDTLIPRLHRLISIKDTGWYSYRNFTTDSFDYMGPCPLGSGSRNDCILSISANGDSITDSCSMVLIIMNADCFTLRGRYECNNCSLYFYIPFDSIAQIYKYDISNEGDTLYIESGGNVKIFTNTLKKG